MPREFILLFTQQLAVLISAGIPLLQALDTISKSFNHKISQKVIAQLHDQVAVGQSLNQALSEAAVFDAFYCQLVAVGEISGNLEDVLQRLTNHLNRQHELRQKVRAALVYPMSVLLIAILVVVVILLWVVPVFQSIFASFGAELPMATRLVLQTSHFLMHWGLAVVLALVLLMAMTQVTFKRSLLMQMTWYKWQLRLPFWGGLFRLANLAIWTRCMSNLVASSVPLLDGLAITAGICPNRCFGLSTLSIRQAVSQGRSMSWSMKAASSIPAFPPDLYPPMLIQMVHMGEEAGALALLLDKAAISHETALEHQVQAMTQLIEPMMVVVLGGLVGGLVVALYLPVFQMGQML